MVAEGLMPFINILFASNKSNLMDWSNWKATLESHILPLVVKLEFYFGDKD